MGLLLSWAEKHGTTPISRMALESLRPHLDEDPVLISHALWAYLNVNLVSAAKEIFNNTAESNGFEVWRKINLLIFPRNELRRDELYGRIHAPRAATGLADIPAAF